MSRRHLAARLAKLEAKLPPSPLEEKDRTLYAFLTMRELSRSIDLQAAAEAGDQVDGLEAYLDTLDARACARAKAPYSEDVQALLRQEYLIGPVEELPTRYPGFESPGFPLVESLFRSHAERVAAAVPWGELFPELAENTTEKS